MRLSIKIRYNKDMIESNAKPDQKDASVVDRGAGDEERRFEAQLRPQTLDEFIGQDQLKATLRIFLEAARGREEPIEHTLLYGNPGLGKTTLANIIASEMGSQLRITSGPALERVGDLAAILSNLQDGDVLFIDEIHRMNRTIEEILYPAMEDFALDLVVGKGPSARTLRLSLNRFTIIGATTRLSLLSSPLRDRFGMTCQLDFYRPDDMARIVERSARLLDIEMDSATGRAIATRSRRTPRIANRLLKRVRDYSQVKHENRLNESIAHEALNMLAIDTLGLNAADRSLLSLIIDKFGGGPVGIQTLAAACQQATSTIEEVHEPFLMQIGFLKRTPQGRMATEHAYSHLETPHQT